MSSVAGFDVIQQKSRTITEVLREIAQLIGPKGEHSTETRSNGTMPVVPGLGLIHESRSLHAQAVSLAEGTFTIVVAGTFKNGKSTLLNAMLGDKQLPAGATPTTGVITMIVYGESDLVQVFEYDKHAPREISREAFFEEYRLKTEDADELKEFRFQNVRYVRMETKHPFCAKGVRLVDSPGLGEHTSRSELTTKFLKESQAVILVLDATKLLSKDERIFITEQLGNGRLDNVFFIVNRINLIDEPDDIDELHYRARSILKPHFVVDDKIDELRFAERVFWVDARSALRGRQKSPPDLALIDGSNVPHFEQQLERFLTEDQMFLASTRAAIQAVVESVQTAQDFIAGEKRVLHQPVERLIEKRDLARKQLDELERRCADIEEIIDVRVRKFSFNWRSICKTSSIRWCKTGKKISLI
ncbi:MAG: hypothetical protein HC828_09425 [Blastochloris sp.]|nr:hypothetical protein [Blastochloris sp.]